MRQGLDSGLFQRITDAAQIDAVLDALMATDWVVGSITRLFRPPLDISPSDR